MVLISHIHFHTSTETPCNTTTQKKRKETTVIFTRYTEQIVVMVMDDHSKKKVHSEDASRFLSSPPF
ncbi:hypothetical protein CesoFtcFv8_019295 [Champsocephalus esox]|uniref:Uncharacterized protein n=1 Tax=Champsocephalus esox TaxID=159716 RepID=A0AAN8BJA4_9TELE|nr:hypothetical protein CesoFtcFv8_019295 [Champsocephalus esox]